MTRQSFSIDRALLDKHLLGAALGDPRTWSTWLVVLRAAFGLQLSRSDRRMFATIAGRRTPPKRRVRELWAAIGRRAGKSRIAAALAVYFAAFVPHKLAAGERGMVLVLAASQEQSRSTFSYALAFLRESPALKREIVETTCNEIRLRNGIVIAIHTNSFRTVRGRTLIACIFDELAFWRDVNSAQPDTEVYSAILPAFATTDGMLIGISSPYRKAGLLYAKHKAHFGVDSDDVLFVQGSSQMFNPSLTDEMVAAQRSADPAAAPSEWDAQFRADLVGFLDDAVIDGAIDYDRPLELPPRDGVRYLAFVDPSGGAAGGDSYTIAICHKDGERFAVDVVRGRQGPFDPKKVTREYAALCREYRINSVIGDAYGREWVVAAWRDEGLQYGNSELPASALYLESLPLWTRGLVDIPDHAALVRELRLLERIPGRVGKDQVTHPRGVHDDLANAVCACLVSLVREPRGVTGEQCRAVLAAMTGRSQIPVPHNPYNARQLGPNGQYGERALAQMRRSRGY